MRGGAGGTGEHCVIDGPLVEQDDCLGGIEDCHVVMNDHDHLVEVDGFAVVDGHLVEADDFAVVDGHLDGKNDFAGMDGQLDGKNDFAAVDDHWCVSDDHLAEMDGQAVAKNGRLPDLMNGFLVVANVHLAVLDGPLVAMDDHFVAEDGFHVMDIHFVETGLVDSVEKDGQSDELDDWSDVVSSLLVVVIVVIVVTSGCCD